MTKKVIKLRLYLIDNGMKQTELTEKTGLSKGGIQNILNTGECTPAHRKLLSLTLGISEKEFFKLLQEYKP